jgi:hypothetical protein
MIVVAMLPAIGEQLSISTARQGLLVSSYAVMVGVFALVAGPISDKIGRRRMLLAGSGLMTAALALHAVVNDYAMLLTARTLAGNREHDSIVSYRIDTQTGKPELVEHTLTDGKTPRNFAIEPSGRFLLAANQNSDLIVVFRIDEQSEKLTRTKNTARVSSPVCLALIPHFAA